MGKILNLREPKDFVKLSKKEVKRQINNVCADLRESCCDPIKLAINGTEVDIINNPEAAMTLIGVAAAEASIIELLTGGTIDNNLLLKGVKYKSNLRWEAKVDSYGSGGLSANACGIEFTTLNRKSIKKFIKASYLYIAVEQCLPALYGTELNDLAHSGGESSFLDNVVTAFIEAFTVAHNESILFGLGKYAQKQEQSHYLGIIPQAILEYGANFYAAKKWVFDEQCTEVKLRYAGTETEFADMAELTDYIASMVNTAGDLMFAVSIIGDSLVVTSNFATEDVGFEIYCAGVNQICGEPITPQIIQNAMPYTASPLLFPQGDLGGFPITSKEYWEIVGNQWLNHIEQSGLDGSGVKIYMSSNTFKAIQIAKLVECCTAANNSIEGIFTLLDWQVVFLDNLARGQWFLHDPNNADFLTDTTFIKNGFENGADKKCGTVWAKGGETGGVVLWRTALFAGNFLGNAWTDLVLALPPDADLPITVQGRCPEIVNCCIQRDSYVTLSASRFECNDVYLEFLASPVLNTGVSMAGETVYVFTVASGVNPAYTVNNPTNQPAVLQVGLTPSDVVTHVVYEMQTTDGVITETLFANQIQTGECPPVPFSLFSAKFSFYQGGSTVTVVDNGSISKYGAPVSITTVVWSNTNGGVPSGPVDTHLTYSGANNAGLINCEVTLTDGTDTASVLVAMVLETDSNGGVTGAYMSDPSFDVDNTATNLEINLSNAVYFGGLGYIPKSPFGGYFEYDGVSGNYTNPIVVLPIVSSATGFGGVNAVAASAKKQYVGVCIIL